MSIHRSSLLAFVILAAMLTPRVRADSPAEPDKDPRMLTLLREARRAIDARQPADAIPPCEEVIARFAKAYPGHPQKVFCARSSPESLGYLLQAASKQEDAIVLSGTYAGAWFIKGFAQIDLGRRDAGKASILEALKLSPWDSQYLAELGEIYGREKDWVKARECYEAAESHATLAPNDSKASELARARRGVGYVLVELGQLEEAAKKYEQCLKDDPNDRKAKAELGYVRGLLAKRKPPGS